jgi:hypothetical protein
VELVLQRLLGVREDVSCAGETTASSLARGTDIFAVCTGTSVHRGRLSRRYRAGFGGLRQRFTFLGRRAKHPVQQASLTGEASAILARCQIESGDVTGATRRSGWDASEAGEGALDRVWVMGPFAAAQHQQSVRQSMWMLWTADMQLEVRKRQEAAAWGSGQRTWTARLTCFKCRSYGAPCREDGEILRLSIGEREGVGANRSSDDVN